MTPADQRRALALARDTITAALHGEALPATPELPAHHPLAQPGACFVTLTRQGELRGCIGTLEPHRALAADIQANAYAAAFRDPRFAPLARDEWPSTQLSISVLGPRQALTRGKRAELLAQLRPGKDGLVIETEDGQRATFLPSVWEQLPQPPDFLDHLKAKAGLPATFDEQQLRAWRYGTEFITDDTE